MKNLFFTTLAFLFPIALFAVPGPISGAGSVCTGAAVTLSDAASGGTWSSSSITVATVGVTTGSVTGLAVGTATISYVTSAGTVTTVITVNPSPGPSFAVSSNFCTTMLQDSLYDYTTGGAWSCSPATIDSISPTGVLYHLSACTGCGNTDVVTYTLPTGCSFSTLVSSNPVVYATVPSAVCVGASATAVGVPAGGTWSSVTPGIESISSTGVISGVSLGTNTISYLSVYGCTVSYTSNVVTGAIIGHHVTNVNDTFCNGPDFYINGCGTSVTSYFGDGTSGVTVFAAGTASADILHAYTFPGTYLVKQVLYNGAAAIDSISFSYEYLYCRTLPIKIYDDNNSDCIFDGDDIYNFLPATMEVDSNGVVIDTINATSGYYYKTSAPSGTVYAFRMLSAPAGMMVYCPSTGVLYDTIQAYTNTYTPKYFGLSCTISSGFDLAEYVSGICGRHHSTHSIVINNTFCTTVLPVLTMSYSPKYNFSSAYPPPSSVSGNVITWDLTSMISTVPSAMISASFDVGSTWLIPGDTIMCQYHLTPLSGDINIINNDTTAIDTVKSSYDPNEMAVTPAGYILPGTQLHYTVNFENTGNDTAFNVSVMDTLSPALDMRSLRIVVASGVMNTTMYKSGGYNVAKFDFPNINLLDSSHHNLCDGMLQFNINTLSGLANGTTIYNHAGIFFDDNPVVMTDTVEDIIFLPLGVANAGNTKKISVYPNPATTELTIAATEYINAVTVSNLLGQLVFTQQYNATQVQVDISALPAGVYFVKVNGTEVRKFVKL